MPRITSAEFESRYGAIVRAEYPELTRTMLRKALLERQPPTDVSDGVLRQWLNVQKSQAAGAVQVSTADELEDKYGATVTFLYLNNRSAFLLCKALRAQAQPVSITDGVAKQWIKKYGTELKVIMTAGHLERECGNSIREHQFDSVDHLKVWLSTEPFFEMVCGVEMVLAYTVPALVL